ncbi:hypothetical protein BD410DRAFT_76463 [Rickenella mellea]|uniref:Mini-chromosome maintenance complex-binding protein n=1 Tax=Rickenella mellea TaxID=50990 RepID=A0A4Y7QDV2_9AGAM|nr:hypothetical protein BD410DRAFT_76463 [Rickenella mellea]
MVSQDRANAILHPTDLVRRLQPDSPSLHFQNIFKSDHAFRQIPVWDARHLPPDSDGSRSRPLVRFRAMIQDTSPSPEVYLHHTGWGIADAEPTSSPINYDNLKERIVLWAVNVPGESSWYADKLDAPDNHCQTRAPQQLQVSKQHKWPLPAEPCVVAQIKIYDVAAAEHFKPTDIVTFVGILASEPENSEFASDALVPTIHVLFHRHLSTDPLAHELSSSPFHPSLRDSLIAWIASEALGNDHDAAEWVLLSCIAMVWVPSSACFLLRSNFFLNSQSRNPPILPPSLTISRFPRPPTSDAAPSLTYVLSELLPRSILVPLSLDLINTINFAPESRDEDLHAGILQLAPGTTVLVTESGIEEGKINEKGVRNLQTLQEAIKLQTLHYVFPYSQFSFPTDLCFIVATEGKKSAFFETSVNLPLAPGPSAHPNLFKSRSDVVLPPPDTLSAFRDWIIAAKRGNFTICSDVSQFITDDFVKDRLADKSVSPEDLVSQMTVARLMSLSRHQWELTQETWALAKALDARRKARD